jgi:hypothetical protein
MSPNTKHGNKLVQIGRKKTRTKYQKINVLNKIEEQKKANKKKPPTHQANKYN